MPEKKPDFELPSLPDLPELPGLPALPDLPDMQFDTLEDEEEQPQPGATKIEEEVQIAESEFQKRAKAESQRFEEATDSEFWVAVCFQTRAQKEAFLNATGLADLGDKYVDGVEVARRLGVSLPRASVARKGRVFSKKLMALADTDG